MRYLLISMFGLVMFSALSCSSTREAREIAVQDWIQTAQRPIMVQEHSNFDFLSTTRGRSCYTLIDQSGKIYFAKNVRFKLPSVIE